MSAGQPSRHFHDVIHAMGRVPLHGEFSFENLPRFLLPISRRG